MKIHLMRSMRSTWCGRDKYSAACGRNLKHTHDAEIATCKVCIKADKAEAARNA